MSFARIAGLAILFGVLPTQNLSAASRTETITFGGNYDPGAFTGFNPPQNPYFEGGAKIGFLAYTMGGLRDGKLWFATEGGGIVITRVDGQVFDLHSIDLFWDRTFDVRIYNSGNTSDLANVNGYWYKNYNSQITFETPNIDPSEYNVLNRINLSIHNANAVVLISHTSNFLVDNILISSPVPEPATWLTFVLGFGFVGLGVRQKKLRVSFKPADACV